MRNDPDHRDVTMDNDPAAEKQHADNVEIAQAASDESPRNGATEAEPQQDYAERIMRMQAEFENYRKRVTRDMASVQERAVDGLILEILPLYDSVLRAVRLHQEAENRDETTILEGLRQIERQFSQWLDSKGIQPIVAVGDLFDPQRHEAVLTAESERPRNEILEEFEPGYFRYDRVLRPSKVSVSRGAKEEESL